MAHCLGAAVHNGYYGQGVGPVHMDEVYCIGDEDSILECSHTTATRFTDHSDDVGLQCFEGKCFRITYVYFRYVCLSHNIINSFLCL